MDPDGGGKPPTGQTGKGRPCYRELLLPKEHGHHDCTRSAPNYSGAWDEHLCNCEQPESPDENDRLGLSPWQAFALWSRRSTHAHYETEAT
jgi:hypothetical protein